MNCTQPNATLSSDSTSSNPFKYCKDCKFFSTMKSFKFPHCNHPSVQIIDLVHGPKPPFCSDIRAENNLCDIEGKLFVHAEDRVSDGA